MQRVIHTGDATIENNSLQQAYGSASEQPMLPMEWAGKTANPNHELTTASDFPRLHTLPRMDHWWRAGRHTISLT